MVANVTAEASELEAFFPQNSETASIMASPGRHKIVVVPKKDPALIESGKISKRDEYNPFTQRKVKNPTTDFETFTHLLKASLGSGILSMPYVFRNGGLLMGLLATSVTAFVCTYCAYILVASAHCLYYRTRTTVMSYPDVTEYAFANGPKSLRRYSKLARSVVCVGLFVTYFGAVSVYTVVASTSFQEVIQHYTPTDIDLRWYIITLLPPLILLGYIPNLKVLAPFSFLANVLMGVGLSITLYCIVNSSLSNPMTVRQLPLSLAEFPSSFTITVFAMEAIGVIMPLENNMEHPTHFLGTCGVLNRGMTGVTLIYIVVGALGFLAYGDDVKGSITSNLDVTAYGPQVAKLVIGMAVLLTYVLQYFVCLNIVWDAIKGSVGNKQVICNYILRTLLVLFSVLVAVIVPTIGPFVSLIGAFCFSLLGIMFPVLIYCVTFWKTRSVPSLLLTNIPLLLFGAMTLFFGTYSSLKDIIAIYSPDNINATVIAANVSADALSVASI